MKVKNEDNAKLGGLVKELGFLFVTQILVSEGGVKLNNDLTMLGDKLNASFKDIKTI